jgi:hypothetical protein
MQLNSTITTRLQYQHKCLVDIIDGLTEEQVRRNILPGKWSIFENIVHLQTYQRRFCERLKRILKEDNPSFERYVAEADPQFLDNCHLSLREVMQDFISLRKDMVFSALALTEKELSLTGTHPFFAVMTIPQWFNFFLLHEAHHFFTILKLSGELRKNQNPNPL